MAFHFCPQCGTKLQPEFRFCPSCGEKLPGPESPFKSESVNSSFSSPQRNTAATSVVNPSLTPSTSCELSTAHGFDTLSSLPPCPALQRTHNTLRLDREGNKEQTAEFIKLRQDNEHLFTGAKNSAAVGWRVVIEKMGLQGKFTPLQAKKKWDHLKRKYKDCKYPGSGEGVSGKPNAATWPWFTLMDEVLGQRPSTRPPVLIASIQEDTLGPSSAVGNQVQDEEERCQLEQRREKRKKDKEDELLDLIREDMRLQREMEERREERMDRLLGLLEKVIEKENV